MGLDGNFAHSGNGVPGIDAEIGQDLPAKGSFARESKIS
jgi:hypothetical protein